MANGPNIFQMLLVHIKRSRNKLTGAYHPATVPVSHVVQGPAGRVFQRSSGHVDDEHVAVDLDVLVATEQSADGHARTQLLLQRDQIASLLRHPCHRPVQTRIPAEGQ